MKNFNCDYIRMENDLKKRVTQFSYQITNEQILGSTPDTRMGLYHEQVIHNYETATAEMISHIWFMGDQIDQYKADLVRVNVILDCLDEYAGILQDRIIMELGRSGALSKQSDLIGHIKGILDEFHTMLLQAEMITRWWDPRAGNKAIQFLTNRKTDQS